MEINKTLEKRSSKYGSFKTGAEISQALKAVKEQANCNLTPSQSEALDMIFSKISRILNGDNNYVDSWHDIAGYATLIEKELTNE